MTATPVSASAAPAKGSRSTEVARPPTPRIRCRARIESASFFRGQRIGQLFNLRRQAERRRCVLVSAARVAKLGKPVFARASGRGYRSAASSLRWGQDGAIPQFIEGVRNVG